MKTNFTHFAKKCLVTAVVLFVATASFAETTKKSSHISASGDLTVSVVNNNLLVNWSNTSANYYEIQASADGKTFTTIGMVLGANPKGNGSTFSFKQQVAKLKPGKVYYRVLLVNTDKTTVATGAVKATK